MSRLSWLICDRIIPCGINVIPFPIYPDNIPRMIYILACCKSTWNSRLFQKIIHGFCISLTHGFLINEGAIHVIFVIPAIHCTVVLYSTGIIFHRGRQILVVCKNYLSRFHILCVHLLVYLFYRRYKRFSHLLCIRYIADNQS